MSETPDWSVIDRYLAGAASVEERRQVDAWVAADAGRAVLLQSLRGAPATEPSFNVDRAWQRFEAKTVDQPAAPRVLPMRRQFSPVAWRYAAAAALIIGAAATWAVTRAPSPAAAPAHELVALNGQRTTVTLSDGTRITLNGGSRLRYGAAYGAQARDVYLDGAAYFEVTHDGQRPFRVHAHGGVVQDVGTKFSVRSYVDQSELEVAVAEGIVALARDSASVAGGTRLSAGDVAVLASAGPPVITKAASLDRYLGWANGSLVLDGVSLSRAATELERWYDIRVIVADSALASRTVVARFRGESPQQAVEAIALALGARYERSGSTYTLRAVK